MKRYGFSLVVVKMPENAGEDRESQLLYSLRLSLQRKHKRRLNKTHNVNGKKEEKAIRKLGISRKLLLLWQKKKEYESILRPGVTYHFCPKMDAIMIIYIGNVTFQRCVVLNLDFLRKKITRTTTKSLSSLRPRVSLQVRRESTTVRWFICKSVTQSFSEKWASRHTESVIRALESATASFRRISLPLIWWVKVNLHVHKDSECSAWSAEKMHSKCKFTVKSNI